MATSLKSNGCPLFLVARNDFIDPFSGKLGPLASSLAAISLVVVVSINCCILCNCLNDMDEYNMVV